MRPGRAWERRQQVKEEVCKDRALAAASDNDDVDALRGSSQSEYLGTSFYLYVSQGISDVPHPYCTSLAEFCTLCERNGQFCDFDVYIDIMVTCFVVVYDALYNKLPKQSLQ